MTGDRHVDPIAIVGMACRYPGGVESPEGLWDLVSQGVDAIGAFPTDRGWDLDRLAGPDPTAPGSSYVRRGGFVDGADRFDAGLFGISPREAEAMDPQQRLLLEVSWEALERAGIDARSLRGSACGVFVGASAADYGPRLHDAHGRGDGYLLTGTSAAVASGRLAYFYGFEGPAITVDTAQSSSLVALHLACQSLRTGESSTALAGGVAVLSSPGVFVEFSRQRGLAPDGRCKAFSAAADGTAFAEGVGVLVLERLRDAVERGHRVLAVIRSSAVNQDGASDGLTAPSGPAQERLIRTALAAAGLTPEDVDVVEAHGTGTRLGDGVEARALAATYGRGRPPENPVWIGSLKSNLGHTQAAAGVAGVIKMAMAMRVGQMPRTLHVGRLRTDVDWSGAALSVLTEHRPWPALHRPRRAAVSSFGISGTNAHLIMEEAPQADGPQERPGKRPLDVCSAATGERSEEPPTATPWALYAENRAALEALARRVASWVADRPGLDPAAVGRELAIGRAPLPQRAVVVSEHLDGFGDALEALARGGSARNLIRGAAAPADGGIVFVFPGQGSQWAGMAADLLSQSHVFRARMEDCDRALRPHTGWSVLEVLRGDAGAPSPDRTDVVQPVLFAVMVALAELWKSIGVKPAAVIGHSQGEVAAACVAGALTLGDAARVVALRAKALASLAGRGGMALVRLPAVAAAARIAAWDGALEIAAVNGPAATVVSGTTAALDEFVACCAADAVDTRRLAVDLAGHSRQIEALREHLLAQLSPVQARVAEVEFYSTVTGEALCGDSLTAGYWYENARATVRLDSAVREAYEAGCRQFIEVSPHPVLLDSVEDILTATAEDADLDGEGCDAWTVGTLRRTDGGMSRFLASAAEAHVRGMPVDWRSLFGTGGRQHLDLPTYPFQRERYWLSAAPEPDGGLGHAVPRPASVMPGRLPDAAAADDAHSADGLRERLAGLAAAEQQRIMLDLVRDTLHAVLGHRGPHAIDSRSTFKDLGVDSLTALELRRRLGTATGLRLPATLVFETPTPGDLARRLRRELTQLTPDPGPSTHTGSGPLDEPIAIVSMACRYPGGVTSPQTLWELISSGGDAIGDFPRDRGWDVDSLYDPEPGKPGRTYVRSGGFLDDVSQFDAAFFGVSPKEALAMDPQQRILLETCWEALERGGLDPSVLKGSNTGVYVGVMDGEYASSTRYIPDGLAGYIGTGNYLSVVSGRLAYTLGLEGPALTIDTACSSSLVALHTASQALRTGECDLALAAGVTILSAPRIFVDFALQQGLSPDGRCKAFAAAADGTGFAEGAGLLVLERLSDARRLGHPVLAVVRGSAVNQDGASNGLTAPNGPSQERVITAALANAGLTPADVDAVEAHGTGTKLGDPIEAQALLNTYGRHHTPERPVYLGSVKSNLGHTQAAAGIAGVIKMVLAMTHGTLPPSLHIDEPTPHVEWEAGAAALLTAATTWPDTGRPRRCGVSSFGISGTNAHVILEAAPAEAGAAGSTGPANEPVTLWPLSAKSDAALRSQADRMLRHLAAHPGSDLADIGYSLAVGRARHDRRAVLLGTDRAQLVQALSALAQGHEDAGLIRAVRPHSSVQGRTVFVFPGQGSQYLGMASGLLTGVGSASQVVRQHVADCAAELRALVDWSLAEVLSDPDAQRLAFQRVDIVQPVLFVVMTALAKVWRRLGVHPDAVVGHSQGEIAAAYTAGALSLSDAIRVVALRARALASLAGSGAMAQLTAGADEVTAMIGGSGELSIAAVNGPSSVVVSGGIAAVESLVARCEDRGLHARRIPVDYASHSAHVEPLREQILSLLAEVRPRAADVEYYSSMTGTKIDTSLLDGAYWYASLRRPVRFDEATRTLLEAGFDLFIESSPHPVMTAALTQSAEAAGAEETGILATLRKDRDDHVELAASLGRAHLHGKSPDWGVLHPAARRVELPTYPFERHSYWLQPPPVRDNPLTLGQAPAFHPLLAATIDLPGGGTCFTGRLSLDLQPWLVDHAVAGTVLLPGTAYLDLTFEAVSRFGGARIDELTLHRPLVLSGDQICDLRVVTSPAAEDDRWEVTFHTRSTDNGDDAPWTLHASAEVSTAASPGSAIRPLTEWPPEGAVPVSLSDAYERLSRLGYEYGPVFQGVRALWRRGRELYADLVLPEGLDAAGHQAHPALLDAAVHPRFIVDDASTGKSESVRLPFVWSGVTLLEPAAGQARVRVTVTADDAVTLTLFGTDNQPLAHVDSLRFRSVDATALTGLTGADDCRYEIDWIRRTVAGTKTVAAALIGSSDQEPWAAAVQYHQDLPALAEAIAAGAPRPDVVIYPLDLPATNPGDGTEQDPSARVHHAAHRALALCQDFLAEPDLEEARLLLLTADAVTARPADPPPDLAAAAAWGLIRSAQTEHPGRFQLIDLDDTSRSRAAVTAACATGEPQIALRDGAALVPRLRHTTVQVPDTGVFPANGTVLITGGTGTLGALAARRLASHHGVGHLLLISRSGHEAPGTVELIAELAALGCKASIVACDTTDADALGSLIRAIPADRRLVGVVHAAGVLDDAVITQLTPERVDTVLRPKADAAWNLHHLTRHLDLRSFILYSSAAGVLGNAGQAGYAAANSVLDALAAHRRAQGLPATSIAWGYWAQSSGMTRHLDIADLERMRRSTGLTPLSTDWALELFDQAVRSPDRDLVPLRLDRQALRARALEGSLPPLFTDLVRTARQGEAARPGITLDALARSGVSAGETAPAAPQALRDTLSGLDQAAQRRELLGIVRTHTAVVLGHTGTDAINPNSTFRELGCNSLSAVELRNRLAAATGQRLPATLVYDRPTPVAVAEFLRDRLAPEGPAQEAGLAGTPASAIQGKPGATGGAAPEPAGQGCSKSGSRFQAITDEDIFRLIDEDLGL